MVVVVDLFVYLNIYVFFAGEFSLVTGLFLKF